MNAPELKAALSAGLGESITVRARRPGLYQVSVPAHLADGDGAGIYVKSLPDARLRVSDIGQTCMRLSYTRKIDADVTEVLERLAAFHGLTFANGEFAVTVPAAELLGATLALLQAEAAAEASITTATRRRVSAERFRQEVRELLQRSFREACQFDYFDSKSDSQGLWKLDALIKGERADIGVAIVPGATEGERAVGTALHIKHSLRDRHFLVAVPRDINDLPELTRKRVMSEFLVPVPAFSESPEKVPTHMIALAG